MKGAVLILCGVIGGLAGGLVAPMFQSDKPTPSARQARPPTDTGQTELIEDLNRRITALERVDRSSVPRETVDAARENSVDPVRAKPSDPKVVDGKTPIPEAIKKRVDALLGKEMTHDATNKLFAWLTLNKSKIPATVAALAEAVKKNPADAELQVAYATALVAQLTNLTNQGPQQGIVWAKASQAYDAAIKIKPEHWQARFGKAFGISMAPEFLGLKPVAIKQFEKLREIQGRQAPAKHHVQTYFRLGTLYKDMGNPEKAREVWDNGLKLFPDSRVLKSAMEASTKR